MKGCENMLKVAIFLIIVSILFFWLANLVSFFRVLAIISLVLAVLAFIAWLFNKFFGKDLNK
jgi:hypothetical protein